MFDHRHIVTTHQLSAEDVHVILDKAREYRAFFSTETSSREFDGAVLVNGFFEASTRTRASFEIAAKRLGLHVVNFQAVGSSVSKGESLRDTLLTLDAMHPDIIVLRHSASGSAGFAAKTVQSHLLNAGDGMHEHPTQALLDVMTLIDELGDVAGKDIGIVGDLRHSRVFRSNARLLKVLGARVHVLAPGTLLPYDMSDFGVRLHDSMDSIAQHVDAIMMLRLQLERMATGLLPRGGEYRMRYGWTQQRAKQYPGVLVLHPGPANYGWEIDEEVVTMPQCMMRRQVRNGVFVRMACIHLLMRSGSKQYA